MVRYAAAAVFIRGQRALGVSSGRLFYVGKCMTEISAWLQLTCN
jgi:hypothetical protein